MKFFETLFLRKVRVFNKARHSRNRQLARVIFYFSLYINIAVIYYIFFVFYGLSFILSWFWWLNAYLLLCFCWGVFMRSSKTIQMFTLFFNQKSYNFFKSGFLLDFFFKKFVYSLLHTLYLVFNIFFSEKYIIEHTSLKILIYIDYLFNLFNLFKAYFSIYLVGFLWLLVGFVLIITYICLVHVTLTSIFLSTLSFILFLIMYWSLQLQFFF